MGKHFSELSNAAQQAIVSATLDEDAGVLPESVKAEIREWAEPNDDEVCTCNERDGSYACQFCYAQGIRGHMQAR